ncbi:MAG: cyclic nucleotide-binding domain-containing protein [Bacteroidales bacterium]
MSRFELFLKYPLFKGMSMDELFPLLTKVSLDFDNYTAGDLLFNKDSICENLVFLLDGRVELENEQKKKRIAQGPELIVFTRLFGQKRQMPLSAKALDNCSIMRIDRKSLLFLMRNSQTVLCNYLDLISDLSA